MARSPKSAQYSAIMRAKGRSISSRQPSSRIPRIGERGIPRERRPRAQRKQRWIVQAVTHLSQ
eukprot:9390455-Pyramimonas_sp.AAC.1